MKLKKSSKKLKRTSSSISFIADIATGFVWIFIKICLYVYRFIKYVFYGLLWPFMFIAIIISKIILKNREVDVEKLRKESQQILTTFLNFFKWFFIFFIFYHFDKKNIKNSLYYNIFIWFYVSVILAKGEAYGN